ncbi:MAG: hypothetical protein IJS29_10105 [Selenomonadaceae bacterium]|nr:hypothetical protein [Selenomonadaceae bacterium]
MEEYAILGGGGLALELADLMLNEGKKICGYYSPYEYSLLNSLIPYLGDEKENFNPNLKYLVASGLLPIRKKMIAFIESNNLQAGSFISSRAYVSSSATLGKGAVIFPFAVIDSFASCDAYICLNFHSLIGHNASLGNNVVISPGARVNGNCKVGNNVSIGANAALIQGTVLEDDVEIGILTYPIRKVKRGSFIMSASGRFVPSKLD